jgi:riboflavin kinase/FMN adenylyltransferase
MEVLRGPSPAARVERASVVSLGVFDGVHLGHAAVLRRTVEAARRAGSAAVAVTFDPHPTVVLSPQNVPPLLTTLERKAELIAAIGVDVLLVLRFDAELASWSAERFATEVIAGDLRAERVIVGANFTFGKGAEGKVETLARLGEGLGFGTEGVPLVERSGRVVSSSSVRQAVADGDLAWPTEALGRPFAIEGRVVAGAGRGVGLGFPTANLEVPAGMLLPRRGVYAGRARVRSPGPSDRSPDGANAAPMRAHPAAINVGTNPTFGDEPLHVEAFLLDFDASLRGRTLAVEFVERLRDEERFDSVEDLVRQMELDVARTRELIGAEGAATGPG